MYSSLRLSSQKRLQMQALNHAYGSEASFLLAIFMSQMNVCLQIHMILHGLTLSKWMYVLGHIMGMPLEVSAQLFQRLGV